MIGEVEFFACRMHPCDMQKISLVQPLSSENSDCKRTKMDKVELRAVLLASASKLRGNCAALGIGCVVGRPVVHRRDLKACAKDLRCLCRVRCALYLGVHARIV